MSRVQCKGDSVHSEKGEYDRKRGWTSPLPLKVPVLLYMYERLLDMNNLHNAFLECKKSVGWKSSVQNYEANELFNLNQLRKRLAEYRYRQKPFFEFDINERGKVRHIKSLHISDRVLQRALCDCILTPAIKPCLIYDNGASVKGKGIEFSRRRLKAHLRKFYLRHGDNGYVLSIDFSKYFDNIRHDRLVEMLKKRIDDGETMELVEYLIGTFGDSGKGVGIGSQISQIAGILYPTEIDSYCKTVRRCRFYGRYMDDTYIIDESKEFLKSVLCGIRGICTRLGIIINERKTQIKRLSDGFTFLKMRYLFSRTGKIVVIPCRKTITRERRKLKKLRARLVQGKITMAEICEQYRSWRGNIKRFNAYKSVRSVDALYKSLFSEVTK